MKKLFLFAILLLSGCSHNLFIPANRFDFPETYGQWLWGQAQLKYEGKTRVEVSPNFAEIPPRLEDPSLSPEGNIFESLALSGTSGLTKNLDLFLKLPLAFSPTMVGLKYQFLGNTYLKRKKGDKALSATLAGGYSRQESKYQAGGSEVKISGASMAFDGAIIGGYRFQKDLLVYGGPFYASYSTNGRVVQTAQTFDFSGEGRQYGFNTGVFSSVENWGAAFEISMVNLAWSYSRTISRVYFGLAVSREF